MKQPTDLQQRMRVQRIKTSLEKINEIMAAAKAGKSLAEPKPSRPALTLIKGGK